MVTAFNEDPDDETINVAEFDKMLESEVAREKEDTTLLETTREGIIRRLKELNDNYPDLIQLRNLSEEVEKELKFNRDEFQKTENTNL